MAIPDGVVRVHQVPAIQDDMPVLVDIHRSDALVHFQNDRLAVEWFGIETICSGNHRCHHQGTIRKIRVSRTQKIGETTLTFLQRHSSSENVVRLVGS